MKKSVKKSFVSLILCAICALTPSFITGCKQNNNAETSVTSAQARLISELFSNSSGNVDYENDTDVLTVYQEQNITDPAWTRVGYNAILGSQFKGATKLESNSLGKLAFYLDEVDRFGNLKVDSDGKLIGATTDTNQPATIYAGADIYSESAPVYKDIDIVNVDIKTGEIVGKLCNPNYPFEWYGRSVTLPAGTVLASGRTLTNAETFTVDVYTYYPTMYIYRRVIAKEESGTTKYYQTISLAGSGSATRNQQLVDAGFVKIDAYYTATFQATVFNADKTVAHNKYGIITRSYAYDRGVLTDGSVSYYATNWGYKNSYVDEISGETISATARTTQAQMQSWAYNLTKAWKDYKTANSSTVSGKTFATACQGENYTAFVYNLLYLVKYANNDSQAQVGYGNGWAYNNISGNVTNISGDVIKLSGIYDCVLGGATIGVKNTSKTDTCGFFNYGSTENPNYVQSAYGYNAAGMNYGCNSQFTYKSGYNDGADKQGLYNVQFLTHTASNNGVATKRYLLDGYVGSNGRTSVFCLGLSNVYGHSMSWIYGTATSYDGITLNIFVNFDNYTESVEGNVTTKNWIMDNNPNAFRSALTSTDHIVTQSTTLKYNITNYNKININLPTNSGAYRYMGTDTTSGSKNSLIGLPVQNDADHPSDTGNTSNGLCSSFLIEANTNTLYGCFRGFYHWYHTYSGVFCLGFSVAHLAGGGTNLCFRSMLV